MSLLIVLGLLVQDEEPATPHVDLRRSGPINVSNQFPTDHFRPIPIAQPHDVLPEGEWDMHLSLDWANSFGRDLDDARTTVLYFVDVETVLTQADIRRGFGDGWEAGFVVRTIWRGGGIMDGMIRGVHEDLGLTNSRRDPDGSNEYRFEVEGESFRRGFGLADPILYVRREWVQSPDSAWRFWTQAGLRIPAADEDFGADMWDLSLQAQVGLDLGDVAVYAGVTGMEGIGGNGPVSYHRFQSGGMLAVDWNFHADWEMIVQAWHTTDLLSSPDRLDRTSTYIGLGLRWHPSERMALELASFENLINEYSSADISFRFGFSWGF